MSKGITYGTNVHIKNMYGKGSYLDSCGHANKCSSTTLYNVYTDSKKDRAGAKTGIWQLISTASKSTGSQVLFGDIVHIKNMYGKGSYLDSCGHANKCSSTTLYNVYTDSKKDRAGAKTGLWQIISSAGKSNGNPVQENDSFHLKNLYGKGSYLDSCGHADKCSSTTLYNVYTDSKRDRAGAKTGVWIFICEAGNNTETILLKSGSVQN